MAGLNGLVHVNLNPSAGEATKDETATNKTIGDSLGQLLAGRFNEWSTARQEIENRWLEDLRAYNGIYDPDVEFPAGKSKIYIHLTRTKVQAAYARMVDLLFQSKDKNWSIEATPVPELPPHELTRLKQELIAAGATLEVFMDPGELQKILDEIVKLRTQRMEREMEDQLAEGEYHHHCKTALLEGTILGSGAIKGVTVKTEEKSSWQVGQNGAWGIVVNKTQKPYLYAPSIFDLYPDPFATSIKDAVGIYERHVLTREHLRNLKNHAGFDAEAIEQVVRDYPSGNHTELSHETERRKISGVTAPSVSGADRYDVLEYWGQVTGQDLSTAGMNIPVEQHGHEFQVNVWVCGMYTIMKRFNPTKPQRLPYQIFPYERVPHQFWGNGVPRQMRDSQITINASGRTLLDNTGASSGPITEVNKSLMAPGEDVTDIRGWGVYFREGGDPSHPMLRFTNIPNITAPLMEIMETFRKFADEETSLPSYTHGEVIPGLNKTASGMSMLMGAASVSTKSTIKNVDDFLIEPLIQSLYDWNMRWNDNDDIKGDMKVVARGSTALLAKEVQSQRTIQFLTLTANPIDMPLTDRRYLLRSAAESLDLDAKKAVPDAELEPQPPVAPGGPGNPDAGGEPTVAAPGAVPEAPAGAVA